LPFISIIKSRFERKNTCLKIDALELRRGIGREANYQFTQLVEPIIIDGGEVTFGPFLVDVKLINTGDAIAAYFDVQGWAHMVCSLCTKPFEEDVVASFSILYKQEKSVSGPEDEDADDMDIVFYQGDLIDVSEDVRQQVILALPMKPVCRPDCKGLCPRCGKDLNEGPCGCGADDIDPRLAVLEDIIKKS
jgi:uncharacterized protein